VKSLHAGRWTRDGGPCGASVVAAGLVYRVTERMRYSASEPHAQADGSGIVLAVLTVLDVRDRGCRLCGPPVRRPHSKLN
jgi:hypothetical protein